MIPVTARSQYFYVVLGDRDSVVGTILRKDGGFVPMHAHKARSLEDAARDVVRRRMRMALAEVERFSQATAWPVNADAVDPSDGSPGKTAPRDV